MLSNQLLQYSYRVNSSLSEKSPQVNCYIVLTDYRTSLVGLSLNAFMLIKREQCVLHYPSIDIQFEGRWQ